MCFLECFDLRLDQLELLLTHEHMMLRCEEDETDDECDDHDSPSESMSGEKYEKRDEEIVDRLIEYLREYRSETTRFTDREGYDSISERSFRGDEVFA